MFGTLISGEWYQFQDGTHIGFCQPDHELHLEDCIICIECKLTQTENAHLQIEELYIPVLEKAHNKKVYGIQATPTLLYKPDLLVHDIADFVFSPTKCAAVWHAI